MTCRLRHGVALVHGQRLLRYGLCDAIRSYARPGLVDDVPKERRHPVYNRAAHPTTTLYFRINIMQHHHNFLNQVERNIILQTRRYLLYPLILLGRYESYVRLGCNVCSAVHYVPFSQALHRPYGYRSPP